MTAGINDTDAAVATIGHIHRLRQRRIGHRQGVRANLQGLDQTHFTGIDHAQGAAVAVTDKGIPRVGAEGDFVMASTGGKELHVFAAGHINHGDTTARGIR
ncbi:hypothetical protein D3C78_1768930 [compost metagenome]